DRAFAYDGDGAGRRASRGVGRGSGLSFRRQDEPPLTESDDAYQQKKNGADEYAGNETVLHLDTPFDTVFYPALPDDGLMFLLLMTKILPIWFHKMQDFNAR
ncbi:MAG TPA: hypothetical protein GX702_04410, partial [Chloroflexi bacterium]|nr:hypothetical protein [Chloroflexota bacterium]